MVSIIGKEYGLPEAFSFHDSFIYWLPRKLDHEITVFIYVNDELGNDIKSLFTDIQEVGRVQNAFVRERGTRVYLCKNPRRSFKKFLEKIIQQRTVF